jgi:hypothetical protein
VSGASLSRSNLKEQVTMHDKDWWLIVTLIKCENDDCGGVCFADELEESDWRCPYCGKPISKPN